MKSGIRFLFLIVSLLYPGTAAFASGPAAIEFSCSSGDGLPQDPGGTCVHPSDRMASPDIPGNSLRLLFSLQGHRPVQGAADESAAMPDDSDRKIIIYFFRGDGCPHCEEEKRYFDGLKHTQPLLEIREYEVWHHPENAALMAAILWSQGVTSSGVPVTLIRDQVFYGFTALTRAQLEAAIEECHIAPCGDPAENRNYAVRTGQVPETSVNIPGLGTLDARTLSLPLLTMVIAGMDSFNPCAFFVLLSLLGLLVHARSRNRMFLIGGIFVFISGGIYFLFMAAWLNLFLVMGHVAIITTIAGGVSVVIAGINIKDFFLFKKGLSLTIPDSARPKLFERMRHLLRSTSLVSILIGATVLAVVANFYELLCTAGFPMVFTRILTLNNLSTATYYLYLLLYNIVYVVPLFIIVLGFTLTLGKQQLSEWQGRVLKLVSGVMMLGLGGILLVNPALLNSVTVSFIILATALGVSLLIAAVTVRLRGGRS